VTQRYDKAFKLLAGNDPRALLALLAGLPLDAEVEIRPLDREVVPQNRLVDHVFEVTEPGGGQYLLHFEVTTRFRREIYEQAAWQVNALVTAYRLPVRSYFVVLTAESFPVRGVEPYVVGFGAFEMRVKPELVRIWEIPGDRVLAMGRPSLYPWITLLGASEEQQVEAVRRVVESRDREGLVMVALLSQLRYRDGRRFLRRYEDMTVDELFGETELYQSALQKGRAQGVAQGLAQGVAQGEQSILLRQLRARFGTLSPEIEGKVHAADKETLERWGVQLLTAHSLDEALA
jgi:predicted transposase YdaD